MTVPVDDLISATPFAALSSQQLVWLAELGDRRSFGTDDQILDVDGPADTFHIVLSGRVAVEVASPNRGPLVIETIDAGAVLGISWLLPPYRWAFGARAVLPTDTAAVDAAAVRSRCEEDPTLGYALYQGFASVIHDRLVSARIRLLDLHGGAP